MYFSACNTISHCKVEDILFQLFSQGAELSSNGRLHGIGVAGCNLLFLAVELAQEGTGAINHVVVGRVL
jgi:hypothetical protein